MKPKPLSSLNHLTVPVAIAFPPAFDSAASAEIAGQKLRPLALRCRANHPTCSRKASSIPPSAGPAPSAARLRLTNLVLAGARLGRVFDGLASNTASPSPD